MSWCTRGVARTNVPGTVLFPPCRSQGENSDHWGRQAISEAPLLLSAVILVLATDVYKQI